jgi:hypothetical protein
MRRPPQPSQCPAPPGWRRRVAQGTASKPLSRCLFFLGFNTGYSSKMCCLRRRRPRLSPEEDAPLGRAQAKSRLSIRPIEQTGHPFMGCVPPDAGAYRSTHVLSCQVLGFACPGFLPWAYTFRASRCHPYLAVDAHVRYACPGFLRRLVDMQLVSLYNGPIFVLLGGTTFA